MNLKDSEIRLVLGEAKSDDVLLALKASSDEVRDLLLGCVDGEDRKSLEKGLKKSDRVRLADAEASQERIAGLVRRLNEEGKVRVIHGDAAEQFI